MSGSPDESRLGIVSVSVRDIVSLLWQTGDPGKSYYDTKKTTGKPIAFQALAGTKNAIIPHHEKE
jgi:hypothetical protein